MYLNANTACQSLSAGRFSVSFCSQIDREANGIGPLMMVWTPAAAQEHLPGTQAGVQATDPVPILPPVYETIDPFLATPAADRVSVIPVVIIRFLPTADGENLDVSMAPDFYTLGEMALSDVKVNIATFNKRTKFMLEEGSRFRGYQDSATRLSLGSQVVADSIWPGAAGGN
jgi:hypothetical protein